jgi:hypothetical protein
MAGLLEIWTTLSYSFAMHVSSAVATLLALTIPVTGAPTTLLSTRQGKFCEKTFPAPPDDVIKARHDKFVDAFLVKKDIVETFTYIAPEYIVRRLTVYP